MNKKDPDMNPDTSEPSAERRLLLSCKLAMQESMRYYGASSTNWANMIAAIDEVLAGQARAGAKESQPVAWVDIADLQDLIDTDGSICVPTTLYRVRQGRINGTPDDQAPLYTHSRAEAPQPVADVATEIDGVPVGWVAVCPGCHHVLHITAPPSGKPWCWARVNHSDGGYQFAVQSERPDGTGWMALDVRSGSTTEPRSNLPEELTQEKSVQPAIAPTKENP